MRIVVLEESQAELRRFWDVMVPLSGAEPACVLPLRDEVVAVLGNRNPFWTHARRRLWIAERAGVPVGRIAGIVDAEHQRVHGDRTGFFGYWECVDDAEAAGLLLGAASEWVRSEGCDRIRGPMNPSINEECGLLVQGHERPNAVMMPHNPAHLARHLEGHGFQKAKDLMAFDIALADSPGEKLDAFRAAAARRAPDVRLIPVTRSNLDALLPALKEIYNVAWERNWSAVPMTGPEIDFLAQRLRPLLVKGLVWLAESRGQPAGLLLAVPDVHEVLGPLRGHLLRPALLRALPVLLGWRQPGCFRLIALGVTAAHRRRGLEGMMFAETLSAARRLGFSRCEASWVLEDNRPVHRLAALFGGRIEKVYRLYDKVL